MKAAIFFGNWRKTAATCFGDNFILGIPLNVGVLQFFFHLMVTFKHKHEHGSPPPPPPPCRCR